MKKILIAIIILGVVSAGLGCTANTPPAQIAATTLPVYEFTQSLCQGTQIRVTRLITEAVSCLHDYSLQTRQMRAIEGAEVLIISGGGLEAFMEDTLADANVVIDASANVALHCGDHHHDHDGHSHESDPHIWLSPAHAQTMVHNICHGLIAQYPEHEAVFRQNEAALIEKLDALYTYGQEQLSVLECRQLITFHDGFTYFAEAFDLSILKAVEEESGSEASAAELIQIIHMVQEQRLPAIFTERNGSTSAADIIAAETGVTVHSLDMAMATGSYFDAMYHNIDTIKEALG